MRGRKGIIFTLIALTLSSLLLILYVWSFETPVDQNVPTLELRIQFLERFLVEFDQYVTEAMRLSTRDTLTAMALYVANDTYVSNTEDAFMSCFLNQTIDSKSCPLQENRSITLLLDALVNLAASQIHTDLKYEIINVTIRQRFPFLIEPKIGLRVELQDAYASWNYSQSYPLLFSIEGLRDPAFIEEFQQHRFISISPSEATSQWGVLPLQRMYDRAEYRSLVGRSPSYLQRFEGDFSPSLCCGIETPVDITLLVSQANNRSFMDHQIYNGLFFSCGTETHGIAGFNPAGFRLSDDYLGSFNIPGNLWVNTSCT